MFQLPPLEGGGLVPGGAGGGVGPQPPFSFSPGGGGGPIGPDEPYRGPISGLKKRTILVEKFTNIYSYSFFN